MPEPREELNPRAGHRLQPEQGRKEQNGNGRERSIAQDPRRQAEQRKPGARGSMVADIFRSQISSGQTLGTLPYTHGLSPGAWSPAKLSPPAAKCLDKEYMYAHVYVYTHMPVQM